MIDVLEAIVTPMACTVLDATVRVQAISELENMPAAMVMAHEPVDLAPTAVIQEPL